MQLGSVLHMCNERVRVEASVQEHLVLFGLYPCGAFWGAKVYECGLQGMHSPLKGGRIPDIYVVIPWVIQKT